MDSMKDILRDARKLHKHSLRLLCGILDGSIKPKDGITREMAITMLKQDIEGSRKMIRHLGGRDA